MVDLINIPFRPVAVILYYAAVLAVIIFIVRRRGDPVKSLSWITVIALIPVVGPILYFLFGRNNRKHKLFDLKEAKDIRLELETMSARQIYELNHRAFRQKREIIQNREIITLLLNSSKSLLSARNRVNVFNDGETAFDALKHQLRSARESIHMEYYIFEKDALGYEIASILEEKASLGVEVRFIYDGVGSWSLNRRFVKRLRRSGVRAYCFMPVAFPWFTSRINYRNHRKIVVVDGRVGFTGGMNIAGRYITGTKFGPWRDTHLMIEGEAVGLLQSTFVTDWNFVSGETITDFERYFPPSEVDIETPVQITASGPDTDWASIMQAFFAAITKAHEHIYISTPYFMPSEAILTAIKVASLSGVDVRILLPDKSDSRITHWASRSYISELLDAKVRVYLYKKGFNHSKLMMIDGMFSSVGTANMDMRSFEDNFEITAILYDSRITRLLEERFVEDLDDSELITAKDWDTRPLRATVYESLSRLLSPLL